MASKTIEIILKAVGVEAVRSAFSGVSDGANGMASDVKNAGDKAASGLDSTASAADKLKDKLETVRNAGLAIGAAGVGALALGNSLANSFLEADRLGARLEAVMNAKGLSGSVEAVKTLGNEIAGLTGGDDDAIAGAIGGAIASGRINGLREYGIVIDAAGQAAIEAAGKISAQAKSAETLTQVLRAGKGAVADMTATLDPATVAAGQFAVRFGNLEEGIGQGAARAKAAILGGLLSPVMSLLEQSPGLQTFAGGFIEIGGAVLAGAGTLISFVAQMVIAYTNMAAFTLAKTAQAAATTAAATAAGAETLAITAAGTATAGAGVAAGGAAVGFGALAVSIGAIAAIAIAAAIAMYALDKAIHSKEDAELAANIAAGDATDPQRLENSNRIRAKRGGAPETMEQFKAREAGDPGDPGADPAAELKALQAQLTAPPVPVPPSLPAPNLAPVFSSPGATSLTSAMPKSRDNVAEALRNGARLVDGGEGLQVGKGTPDLSQSEVDQLFGILGKKVSARVRAAIEGGAKLVDGGEVVQVSKGTPDLSQSEVDQLFGILEGQKARGGAPNARFAAMSGGQIGGGVSVMGGDSGLSTNARAGKGTLQLDASVTGQSANGNYILEIIAPKSIEIPNTGISSLAGGY